MDLEKKKTRRRKKSIGNYPKCKKCGKRRRGRYKSEDFYECLICGNIYDKKKEWYINGGIEIQKISNSQLAGAAVNGKPIKKIKKPRRMAG